MSELEDKLRSIIAQSHWLSRVLRTVRDVGPGGAYVAAGAIRNTVWDFLSGRKGQAQAGDVDVVYFDAAEVVESAPAFEKVLAEHLPEIQWELTNQAHVHRWYRSSTGECIAPLRGVSKALAMWPETATAVGARLTHSGVCEIVAPLGLEDLFAMVVRHNPGHGDAPAYRARVASKRWKERWPQLTIVES